MHVVILTLGSRGDVQPYVALGTGLRAAGCEVTLATDAGFADLADQYGLRFAPLHAGMLQLAQSPEGKAALAGKGRFSLMKQVMPILRQVMDDAWAAAQAADTIVFHPKALAGIHIAEKRNVPGFLALPLPLYSPTADFAVPILGGRNLGGWLNRQSYGLFLAASTMPYRGLINRWRKETLGLPPTRSDATLHGKPVPKLYAYSPAVVPAPPDWDASSTVTGYWFLPPASDWQPPDDLLRFLAGGAPPIYVGFGSMVAEDPQRLARIVLAAAQASGQRLILARGWGGLATEQLPPGVFLLESAPHDWLFPQCAAVIHHGGAGTTGAGLRAGRPTLICPFFGDQPFWGDRVWKLGAGPRPIAQKKLTAEELATAMTALATDQAMRLRAEELGRAIQGEDGVARAVALILHATQ
jgi:sterol 3beta-glucosyltransferase